METAAVAAWGMTHGATGSAMMTAEMETAAVAAWRKNHGVTGAAMCVGMGACSLMGIRSMVCAAAADVVLRASVSFAGKGEAAAFERAKL